MQEVLQKRERLRQLRQTAGERQRKEQRERNSNEKGGERKTEEPAQQVHNAVQIKPLGNLGRQFTHAEICLNVYACARTHECNHECESLGVYTHRHVFPLRLCMHFYKCTRQQGQ